VVSGGRAASEERLTEVEKIRRQELFPIRRGGSHVVRRDQAKIVWGGGGKGSTNQGKPCNMRNHKRKRLALLDKGAE